MSLILLYQIKTVQVTLAQYTLNVALWHLSNMLILDHRVHMLNVKKQNTILVLVTVTCSSEMACHLVGVLLFFFLPFSLSLFFLPTLPHSSTGTIITLKMCQDKIEKSSSLHYLLLQLLDITTSKCDLHHLVLIKPLDQIFTKLPEPKLLEENSFYFKEQEGEMK